ncbi:hypothetical protein [Amycolatopsis thailandensis]|nr:hypothetical protein [Amycolatopsis thailandensis]
MMKRFAETLGVLAIIWGTWFATTLPFGVSDLHFSLVFATVLTAVTVISAGMGKLVKRAAEGWKRSRRRR